MQSTATIDPVEWKNKKSKNNQISIKYFDFHVWGVDDLIGGDRGKAVENEML